MIDPGNATQLILVVTSSLILGRVGLALARLLEHRASVKPSLTPETEDRLRTLEVECDVLRQEVTELQERQDFTERALLQDPVRAKPVIPPASREKIVTPH
jgi:hypothetical protein